jgi:23S rRNA pseudouridine2604 synthase
MQTTVRLNKFISESGLCSRREADRFIEQGVVFINGRKGVIGDQVKPGDRVRVNGKEIEPLEEEDIVLIALNKPVGITCTTEDGIQDNIVDFVRHEKRIFPIGRLDKDSQGLIFLTNNGDLVNKILRAGNNHEKEYLVTVHKPLTPDVIKRMANGVPMLGTVTKKCKIVQESPTVFRIFLVEGLNRQIRRMCGFVGYEVKKLERVRIMNVSLDGLANGEWRDLTNTEKNQLYQLVAESSSEAPTKQLNTQKKPQSPSSKKGTQPPHWSKKRTNSTTNRSTKTGGFKKKKH